MPGQPYHNLSSINGNQLAPCIIKPWTIKPMEATKYANTYQMHKQKGSFHGIDTCNVTNFGNFNFTTILLDENESRWIVCRPDINILIMNLQKENIITKFTAEGLRNRTKKAYPSRNFFKKIS